MHPILIAGSGKVGHLIACLLAESKAYKVFVGDVHLDNLQKHYFGNQQNNVETLQLDATDPKAFKDVVKRTGIKTVISSLPYFCNEKVAQNAKVNDLNYFDLTEDVKMTETIQSYAQHMDKAFVLQCGLAPGFITIVANDLMQSFDVVETVQMRVGALPIHSNNFLKYALNWSTDGLINEYGNACLTLKEGKLTEVEPLEGLERIEIDGLQYEAFNTSGGLGSLATSYEGKVKTMNYKTVRYPGHCEKIRLLMNDLHLNDDRVTLKRLLENVIPRTHQDVVLIYVSVKGLKKGQLIADSYFKKIYPAEIAGRRWSAIQTTTASGICSVIDIVLNQPKKYKGLVLQEQFKLSEILSSRFGKCYV